MNMYLLFLKDEWVYHNHIDRLNRTCNIDNACKLNISKDNEK